jgi:hypothetical protein
MGAIGREIDQVLGDLVPNESVHLFSKGSWSNHNLIAWLLKKTGPADVYLTSWTVSEVAVRTLINLIESGLINSLHGLFDERIKVHCPQAHQLASQTIADLRLTKIHAKCIVVINKDWGVSVSTSANMSVNRSIEKYVICTDRKIAEADRDLIMDELQGKRPFENERT